MTSDPGCERRRVSCAGVFGVYVRGERSLTETLENHAAAGVAKVARGSEMMGQST